MTNHYYSENPAADHDEKNIYLDIFEKKFSFKTDAGVFSKNRVDFGSQLMIETFAAPIEGKVLDLGCGYGPIGIIIGSFITEGELVFADVNRRAIELVRHNLELNRRIFKGSLNFRVLQSAGFEKILDRDFDIIMLNPPIRAGKELIYRMFEDAFAHLKDDGEFWIVIQKKQGADSAVKKLESIFPKVEQVNRDKGYLIIKSVKQTEFTA